MDTFGKDVQKIGSSGTQMGARSGKEDGEMLTSVEEMHAKMQVSIGRMPVVSPVRDRPTEVLERNTTHSPPCSCCQHCAKGMSTNKPHCKQRKDVPDVTVELQATPTASIDLM